VSNDGDERVESTVTRRVIGGGREEPSAEMK
jgi:hypothetical protein